MYYINTAASISAQESNGFQFNGLNAELTTFETLHPNYKAHIPIMQLRRMKTAVRMGMFCGKNCVETMENEPLSGIYVGSGLGCIDESIRFLDEIQQDGDAPFSPGSFIQSTHNTVSGQLAIQLKCHGPNMTYVDRNISFELALQDALLQLEESGGQVLVGGVDEHHNFLQLLADQQENKLSFAEGASFFHCSKIPQSDTSFGISLVKTHTHFDEHFELETWLIDALTQHGVKTDAIDLILYSGSRRESTPVLDNVPVTNYEAYSGVYCSNSAFALHLAAHLIQERPQNILIVNHFQNQTGLMFCQPK